MRGRLGRSALLGTLAVCLASSALAAARARLGGTLGLGLVGLPEDGAVDTPEASSARAPWALPLCRLWPNAVPASLAARVVRDAAGVQVLPREGARFPDGTALTARDVAETLAALARGGSPYGRLLAPIQTLEAQLTATAQHPEAGLLLQPAYAWPDLEASLCHPAFAPTRGGAGAEGVGLYGPLHDGRAPALQAAPGGAPYPAFLRLSVLSARAAARALQRGEVHALLGQATPADGQPALFATYLVYARGSLPEGVAQALAHLDTEALVRTFVPGAAQPLRSLLPEGAGEGTSAPAPPSTAAAAPAPPAGRAFALGYEGSVPEARAVAERLQVLLHDAGFAVRLLPGTREALSRARAAGRLEAQLVSVLLPPLPAPALALVLGLTGDEALLARELPPLGAVADAEARGAQARARARALLAEVPILPLYVRGLRVQAGPALVDARRDAYGLLVLDDAWLSP